MKAVVLTLALLFLTGSQAQHETQQEEPPSQWERVKDLAQMYLNSTKVSGREYIAKFEETELAKNLNLKVLAKLDTLSNKVANLTKQLRQTQNFWDKVKNEMGMLTGELKKDLKVVNTYLGGIQKKWQERVKPLGQDLHKLAGKQLQKLQEKLGQLGAKVLNGTRVHVERARPYMDSLHPFLETMGEELRQCLEPCNGKLRECLEPYGEQLQALQAGGLGLAKMREQVGEQLGKMNEDLLPLWASLQDFFLPFLDISQRLTGQ
ncbi:apolipoprotein A-I [Myotis yumanensis]|uniref:apolipoprotein A-I n=1 Tax=Myotis yumanensis TaxID=159337 RepID=UPI0038D45852